MYIHLDVGTSDVLTASLHVQCKRKLWTTRLAGRPGSTCYIYNEASYLLGEASVHVWDYSWTYSDGKYKESHPYFILNFVEYFHYLILRWCFTIIRWTIMNSWLNSRQLRYLSLVLVSKHLCTTRQCCPWFLLLLVRKLSEIKDGTTTILRLLLTVSSWASK